MITCYDERYLIRTLDDTPTGEDVVLGHKQPAVDEDAFRTLKSCLELQSMFRRQEERTPHGFCCAGRFFCW